MLIPGEFLLSVTVQVATLPFTCRFAPKHVWLKVLNGGLVAWIALTKKVGVVPAGIALIVTVNTCWLPTAFTPLGVIWMLASTTSLVSLASPQPPAAGSVFGESPEYDATQWYVPGAFGVKLTAGC